MIRATCGEAYDSMLIKVDKQRRYDFGAAACLTIEL